jgi:hypothetical protein
MMMLGDIETGAICIVPPRRPRPGGGGGRPRSVSFAPALLGSRTILTRTTAPQSSQYGRTLIWNDADPGYGNRFVSGGSSKELLIARNTSGSAQTVSVRSVADAMGRTGDQVELIGAGNLAIFGPFQTDGWRQLDGHIWVDAASSDVKLAVVILRS